MQTQEHLNAQQVSAIEGKVRAAVQAYIREMDLRKWAAERAAEIAIERELDSVEVLVLAESIYNFVTQPDKQLTVQIT